MLLHSKNIKTKIIINPVSDTQSRTSLALSLSRFDSLVIHEYYAPFVAFFMLRIL